MKRSWQVYYNTVYFVSCYSCRFHSDGYLAHDNVAEEIGKEMRSRPMICYSLFLRDLIQLTWPSCCHHSSPHTFCDKNPAGRRKTYKYRSTCSPMAQNCSPSNQIISCRKKSWILKKNAFGVIQIYSNFAVSGPYRLVSVRAGAILE